MAKKSMIEREKKRIKLNNKYTPKRNTLLQAYRQTEDFQSRLDIHSKIQKLPRNSAKNRIRNRCWKTGRPRGFYRDFGVSRHVLREMAHSCLLPGVTKSSW
jgi:small subunit ribosomal protein S14|uniref:Small ribosomal subunit protein uS14c n=1 Tax=Trieres chinensis TaxID=1514140 RepID=RR14_TRICV|nr:ribosomal protein S14 [Trieres chinensis]YP_010537337.1 ribosomal protein S14 [Odontella regia]P49502.1 RecName: Full=Small ribosomal subunit protein uS14c; AltName: Full=30S ribosomal protein S14, chloroplastic [Trieres chinensis]UYC31124.1 ribosomal protein S14 [Odontella regia]CAA91675.1 30S ribosomal protein S14 [Trieres chinensis]|mmetsp:Transcript_27679/g.56740  ORF Transcript_27679/g.56740 Transcript_27679/m.56740 type:complete len:101 (+) Transcript_27679:94-396(+)